MRRVGVLLAAYAETDRAGQTRMDAFRRGLQGLGWVDMRSIRYDDRWGDGNAHRGNAPAAVLVQSAPATDGGLLSYGPDQIDQWRGAAGYVDRILRGEKPADLLVQALTKYEFAVNLKAAKAIGGRPSADSSRARRRGG